MARISGIRSVYGLRRLAVSPSKATLENDTEVGSGMRAISSRLKEKSADRATKVIEKLVRVSSVGKWE